MQKATFAITVPHFFLPISAYISEAHRTSIISRFKVHETLQINQSNFFILLFKVYKESQRSFLSIDRKRYLIIDRIR